MSTSYAQSQNFRDIEVVNKLRYNFFKLIILFALLRSVGSSQCSGEAEALSHVVVQGYRGFEKESWRDKLWGIVQWEEWILEIGNTASSPCPLCPRIWRVVWEQERRIGRRQSEPQWLEMQMKKPECCVKHAPPCCISFFVEEKFLLQNALEKVSETLLYPSLCCPRDKSCSCQTLVWTTES